MKMGFCFKDLSLMSLLFCCEYGFSQSALVVGGGNVYEDGIGEMSASVGQIDFQYAESDLGSITAGVQQSVLILPNELTRTSQWSADDFSIRVAPIPTSGVCSFSIEGGNAIAYDYMLTDLNGRLLLNGTASNGSELNLSAFDNGVYFLMVDVKGSNCRFITFKIIKD